MKGPEVLAVDDSGFKTSCKVVSPRELCSSVQLVGGDQGGGACGRDDLQRQRWSGCRSRSCAAPGRFSLHTLCKKSALPFARCSQVYTDSWPGEFMAAAAVHEKLNRQEVRAL